jgi:uncharacterized membrane protein YczE
VASVLATVALAGAALWLLVTCWRHRAVLGVICAALALGLAFMAALSLPRISPSTLVGSFLAIVIGTVLLTLGRAVERLLDEEPGGRD